MSRLVLLLATVTLTSSASAEQYFVRVSAQVQGLIANWHNPVTTLGGVELAEYGEVADLSWSIRSPRDAASGLPTGKRVHTPLVLRVRMSGAISALGNSLTQGENLTEVRVHRFVDDLDSGAPELATTMVLTNASLSAFNVYTVREADGLVTYSDFQLYYQAIGIEDVASGTSYSDDWESPVR